MNEDYRESAKVVFEALSRHRNFARQMQGEYGKWLISSLLFLHTAAIGGVALKLTDLKQIVPSLWWFVIGIVFALGAGFAAWWNFSLGEGATSDMADYRMLRDPKFWPVKNGKARLIHVTFWLSVASGILSVVYLVAGAWCVAMVLTK